MAMKVFIFGYGVEGKAAASYFLKQSDWEVVVTDDRLAAGERPSLGPTGTWLTTDQAATELEPTDLFLRSPGIKPTAPLVEHALALGCRVTTPTGYWLTHLAPTSTVTVTGTKGKSSTVALTAHLLEKLGHKSVSLGNIGSPPLGTRLPAGTVPVIELSSYMMHDLPEYFGLHVITSLYREHTDWHGTEDAYRAAKLRPFRQKIPARGLAPREIIERERLPNSVEAIEDVSPLGHAEDERGVATAIIGALLGETAALHAMALTDTFEGLPNRQEIIPTDDGWLWVNDALATIPEATLRALDRWADKPTYLLLGGADRGQSFDRLAEALARRVNLTVYCFEEVADRLTATLASAGIRPVVTSSYAQAVEMAKETTKEDGSLILFSPAAPSVPPATFATRGALFKKAAHEARP